MDRALPAPRTGGTDGTFTPSLAFTEHDTTADRRGLSGSAPSASVVGRQETADHRAPAPPALGAAAPLDGLRLPEPKRDGAEEALQTAYRPSRQAHERHPRAQR